MKKYFNHFFYLSIAVAALWTGCDVKETVYQDQTYTQFADSLYNMPVTTKAADQYFEVDIASTNKVQYDRNYIVEIDHSRSNAIEGYHFDMENPNVVIKAGERATKFRMKAYYDKIGVNDSLVVTYKLVSLHQDSWNLYPQEAQVNLVKCLPFRLEDYAGDLKMRCTFPFSSDMTTFLLKSEKKNDRTLILKTPFSDVFDLSLKFTADEQDPFNQDITVAEQPVFIDANYGKVYAASVGAASSYYLPEDRAIILYLNMYLPKVGSFGGYYYILEWLSPEEAEASKNETGASYIAPAHRTTQSVSRSYSLINRNN